MKRVIKLIAIAALAGSGAYVFVYLYRWEWNRALMALMLFVAVEIAIAVSVILDKLRSIDERLAGMSPSTARTLHHVQEAAPESRKPFAWLEDGEVGVFIPVLLGAGAVLSAVAWCVERLATMTTRPVLERSLAHRLEVFALPEGGLLATDESSRVVRHRGGGDRIHLVAKQIAIFLAAAFLLFTAIRLMADITQNREDEYVQKSRSVVTLSVLTNAGVDPVLAAESLWGTCRGTVPGREAGLRTSSSGHVILAVEPSLGVYDVKRLQGCLEDARLDHVQAGVVAVE